MKEKDIIAKCRKWATEQGCKVVKMHGGPFTERGIPDLLICLRGGRFCAAEAKVPGKEPTALQMLQIADFKRAGAIAFWFDSFEDFKENVEDFLA